MTTTARRPVLYIPQGLPGSGKSWHARAWVAEDPDHRARVSRDDLRMMLRGGGGHGHQPTERRIDAVRDAAITALLRSRVDVIADSTNLHPKAVADLIAVARCTGAAYEMVDFTMVPLELCLARNAERADPDRVPEDRIRQMHARYIAGAA